MRLEGIQGKVCYRYGEGPEEVERMDYLEFIARIVSHIPDKGQVTVREVQPISGSFMALLGFPAPFRWFQLALTSDDAPIYHP